MGIFSMNMHQFGFTSMFTSIGMFFCLVGSFISVVVNIALTHQTKPAGRLALQSRDRSLRVSPRPLCSCSLAEGFPAGKGKYWFSCQRLEMDKILQKSIKEQHQQKVLSFYVMRFVSTGAWLSCISYCQKYFPTFCLWICFSNSLSDEIDQSL